MSAQTFEAVLHPDGHLSSSSLAAFPDHPVRVQTTLLEESGEKDLTELGNYLEQLSDYEDRLARGEIRWQ